VLSEDAVWVETDLLLLLPPALVSQVTFFPRVEFFVISKSEVTLPSLAICRRLPPLARNFPEYVSLLVF